MYMSYPWPHLHQASRTIAAIVVERNIDGEDVPMFFFIRKPEETTLLELDARLRLAGTMPIEEFLRGYRVQPGERLGPEG